MAATSIRPAPSRTVALLGGRRTVRAPSTRDLQLRAAVRQGLPYQSLEELAERADLPPARLAKILGIPPRTIARRRAANQLTPEESDRLYRLARGVAYAQEVLGSLDRARAWLLSPNRALDGEAPLDLLDTDIGARQVEEVLLRLHFGIYS